MARQSARGRRKHTIWYVLTVVIAIVVTMLLAANQIAINADRTRFADAEKTKSNVVSALVENSGSSITSTKQSNECFNTEQGPYDHGRLWCQVSTILILSQNVSFDYLGHQLVAAGFENGKPVSSSGRGITLRYWYKAQGMYCTLAAIDQEKKKYGSSTFDVLAKTAPPAASISCADRARAAYYPFVD